MSAGRAKSTSARDLRYGRQGGRTDAEQAEAFAAALDSGEIVHGKCRCTRWWLAKIDVGSRCLHCDERRMPLAQARHKLSGNTVDCPPECRCSVWCRDEWEYARHAIGACEACGEPCRSVDPEGRKRHPSCGVPSA
jgi:hypothetical protein